MVLVFDCEWPCNRSTIICEYCSIRDEDCDSFEFLFFFFCSSDVCTVRICSRNWMGLQVYQNTVLYVFRCALISGEIENFVWMRACKRNPSNRNSPSLVAPFFICAITSVQIKKFMIKRKAFGGLTLRCDLISHFIRVRRIWHYSPRFVNHYNRSQEWSLRKPKDFHLSWDLGTMAINPKTCDAWCAFKQGRQPWWAIRAIIRLDIQWFMGSHRFKGECML